MSYDDENWESAPIIHVPLGDFDYYSLCHVSEEDVLQDKGYWSALIRKKQDQLDESKFIRDFHEVALPDVLEKKKYLYYVHVFPAVVKKPYAKTKYENDFMDAEGYHWYCVDLEVDWIEELGKEIPDIESRRIRYVLGYYKIPNEHLFRTDDSNIPIRLIRTVASADHTRVDMRFYAEQIKQQESAFRGTNYYITSAGRKIKDEVIKFFRKSNTKEEEISDYYVFPGCTEDPEYWGFRYTAVVFRLNGVLERFISENGRLPDGEFKIRGSLVLLPDEYFQRIKDSEAITDKEEIEEITAYLQLRESITIRNENSWITGLATFPGSVGLLKESESY